MLKSWSLLSLSLLLLSYGQPVFADATRDCYSSCKRSSAECIEQVHISAGNVQEEQDMIAACNKVNVDCMGGCRGDEETQPEQKPEEKSDVDTSNGIKTYEFKD